MIVGVGVDVVTVSRIEAILSRHGDRFLERVLSLQELAGCPTPREPRWIAKRFAVKEAFSKALGTGLRGPMSFQNISLTHQDSGQPGLQVHGPLQAAVEARKVTAMHVSISDEEDLAMAFVVLEGQSL